MALQILQHTIQIRKADFSAELAILLGNFHDLGEIKMTILLGQKPGGEEKQQYQQRQ